MILQNCVRVMQITVIHNIIPRSKPNLKRALTVI